MGKKHLIKFEGFRTWKEKKLMVKFKIEKVPAKTLKKIIKEIKKCKGLFWSHTGSWYVPAGKYSKFKGRIKRQNFLKVQD